MSDYADKNELYHWLKGKEKPGHKYTSRYMKNGKWRYVYGAAKNLGDRVKDWWGVDEKERLDKAYRAYRYGDRDKHYSDSVRSGDDSPWGLRISSHDHGGNKIVRYDYHTGKVSSVKDAYDPGEVGRRNLNAKRNAYERAKTAYYKTPMGKLEKTGEKVSKAMSKASSWIKKKTSSVKKKLSELSGGKEKLAKANQATVSYAFNSFAIANNKKNRDKYKDYNPKTNKYRDTHDPTDFDRQYLNAKRNAYQRSQDAYNKSLRGRINNAFTRKKKKKNK